MSNTNRDTLPILIPAILALALGFAHCKPSEDSAPEGGELTCEGLRDPFLMMCAAGSDGLPVEIMDACFDTYVNSLPELCGNNCMARCRRDRSEIQAVCVHLEESPQFYEHCLKKVKSEIEAAPCEKLCKSQQA